MLFFESFGSILPSLAYLSLIWICVLFGFRVQIRQILHLPVAKNEIKANASSKQDDSTLLQYFASKNTIQISKDKTSLPSCVNDYTLLPVPKFNRWKIKSSIAYTGNDIFCFFSRRGPPSLVA
jgi:hypothetical protein